MRVAPPDRMRSRVFMALLCASLTACVARAPSPPLPANAQAPSDFPHKFYREAIASGQAVLRVDPRQSFVAIEVRRGGTLARLGHDHVVASRDVSGYVLPSAGRADLYLPLARLTVDEASLRAESGMDKPPSQEAIDGTRRNMLEKVLEADRFPFARIHVAHATGNTESLRAAITLHGQTRTYDAPARIEHLPGKMVVNGRLTISQTDFGITPFSVLGGALQVQDRLEMRYRIVAEHN